MTPGNLCLVLALPKIVVRPQIWHDRAPVSEAKWSPCAVIIPGLHCSCVPALRKKKKNPSALL